VVRQRNSGTFLEIALRNVCQSCFDADRQDLITEGDRVTGVLAEHDGKQIRIEARLGVLINAGAFRATRKCATSISQSPSILVGPSPIQVIPEK